MDLKQLTALVTVADVGSVTQAARLLHLVQPAVSRQIRTLEEEIGTPLFDRTRSGMVPTAAGEALIESARRVLHELDRALAEIRPQQGELTGIVTVGVLDSVLELVVEPLVRVVSDRYPGIALRFLTAYSVGLQRWLELGDVDVSLLHNPAESAALVVIPVLDERLWAVAPADVALNPEVAISWASMLGHPLVMPMSGHGIGAVIDRARSSIPTPPEVSFETNSMYVQKALVRAGYGWTVLPAAAVAVEVAGGLLSGAPLTDPEVSRSVVVGLRRRDRTAPPVAAVAEELEGIVQHLVRSGAWPSASLVTEARNDEAEARSSAK